MSIVQAILLGVLYWIGEANLPFVGLWTVQRPLVCGWIAGIILGDALTGAMVGASINLVYLGFISAGGSMPADMALAGTLGAAFAITGIWMPIQLLHWLFQSVFWVHWYGIAV